MAIVTTCQATARVGRRAVSRYRNRGDIERYSMSAADATYLVSDLGAAESGVAGAVFHGQLLQAAGATIDLYVSRQAHDAMGSVVVAVADPLGSVVVRIVSDEVWPEVDRAAVRSVDGRLIAPPAAVALDLMESGDARHWVAAENLVGANG